VPIRLGTSCLATIVLSLRDKSHSPIETPRIILAPMGLKPWAESCSPSASGRVVSDCFAPFQGLGATRFLERRTQLKKRADLGSCCQKTNRIAPKDAMNLIVFFTQVL
jgi:hypothetical protein